MNFARERTIAQIRARLAFVKPRRRRLPRMVPPDGIIRDYGNFTGGIVAKVEAELAPIIADLPRLVADLDAERRHDEGTISKIQRALDAAKARIRARMTAERIEGVADEFAGKISSYQLGQFHRQIKAGLGIDILVTDPKLANLLKGFASQNVAIMDDLAESTRARISSALVAGVQGGLRHEQIAENIRKASGVSESRAQLVARDQVLTLYSQINESRQRAIGVTEFIWRTVGDERVRPTHVANDGWRFEFKDPPPEGTPGTEINCRCYAEPVFDDLLKGL